MLQSVASEQVRMTQCQLAANSHVVPMQLIAVKRHLTRDGEKLIDAGNVVHCFGQEADVVLPGLLVHFHVTSDTLAFWGGSKCQCSIDDLRQVEQLIS